MKMNVYLETSFISYLTGAFSRDLVVAANQQVTQDWWAKRKKDFNLFISEFVFQEARKGDSEASDKRILILETLQILETNEAAIYLAEKFIKSKIIPKKATQDSLHIAIATIHEMNYLLTWNCTHIANAEIQKGISKIIQNEGYEMPIICTPAELMGG
jgi:hypothetical protein